MKKCNIFNMKIIFNSIILCGIILSLIYIFCVSSALLSSESVITDVIAHQQFIRKEILLSNWYYGSEIWLFSFSIPSTILSLIIKNNLLSRQLGILFTAIIFFIMLFKLGKLFIGKRENFVLIALFTTGISYSVLDYFYAYSSCLNIIINSMLLLYLYYKCFEENNNKKIYYILSLILTFIFGITNFQYFPLVIIPFIFIQLILHFKNLNWKKISGIVVIGIISFITFNLLCNKANINSSKKFGLADDMQEISLSKRAESLLDITFSFFGYDNRDNALESIAGKQYFIRNKFTYSLLSKNGAFDFIKVIASLVFVIIAPIMLFKNYKKNDKKINFLLGFNTLSWIFMIIYYIFFNGFIYSNAGLRYFLFNFILNIIFGLYFLYSYVSKQKMFSLMCNIFIVLYMISNINTISMIIGNRNNLFDRKMELVSTLKKNKLTFGYGSYYNSLLVNYLSNYDITVSNIDYSNYINPYKIYSDEKAYHKKGKVFFIIDKKDIINYNNYVSLKPDERLLCDDFTILIYNSNPLNKE